MEYIYLEVSWKDKLNNGEIKEAIEAVRIQIATNLMNIHNMFSDEKMTSPEDVYAFTLFEDIREEERERFTPFERLGNTIRELEYDGYFDIPEESTIDAYQKLEEELKEAMENI